jgi:hypothetical protein
VSDLAFDAGDALYCMHEPNDLDDHALVVAATCQSYLARSDPRIDTGETLLNRSSDVGQDQIID